MQWLMAGMMMLMALPAAAQVPYKVNSAMLLQPDFVLQERLPSVDALAGYVKAVDHAAGTALATTPATPASGWLVLAVRPGHQSMAWLDFDAALPAATAEALRTRILAVPPFAARAGVVVVALNVSLWDAPAATGFPNPPEWRAAVANDTVDIEIGALVERVWPAQGRN